MAFQQCVTNGFGLCAEHDTEEATVPTMVQKNIEDTRGEIIVESDRDTNRELEQLAVTLVAERNLLLDRLRESRKEIKRLQSENDNMRNENQYRHLMMRKMKNKSKRQAADFDKKNAELAKTLELDGDDTYFINWLFRCGF
jgi:hypothetical protein